jgi:hypothetical protein
MNQFKFFKGDILKQYDIPGYKFIGCSGLYFNKEKLQPYRFKMYVHIDTNIKISADIVYGDNPIFNIVHEEI